MRRLTKHTFFKICPLNSIPILK